MKSILLFPGIDAIESDQIRYQCIQIPEVQLRIKEAQAILDKFNVPVNLLRVLKTKRQENVKWFSAMVLGSMPIQVGVFDRYKNEGKPIDGLLGMSLGDIARSVCAGVTSFTSAFIGLLKFIQKIPGVLGSGSTYQVRLDQPMPNLPDYLRLKSFDLEISAYQSDRSILVSGPVKQLKSWHKLMNKRKDVQAKELFNIPVPLHSRLLKSTAFSLAAYIYRHTHIEQIRHPIYSTIFNKWIVTSEELKKDMLKNIYTSVQFTQSIHQLTSQEKRIEFVNIGPASTMFAFIKQMNISRDVYQFNHFFSEACKCLI